MKPPAFDYQRPESVDEAVSALEASDGGAKVLAGGQSLIPMMNTRLASPETLIDINRITDLDYVRAEDGGVAIGALTRQSTVERSDVVAEHCPLIAEALDHVGHRPIRNRGTVGGNLAHADPTSELPAVAVALGADFTIRGAKGERTVPAAEFFVGMMTTALAPDELLTEVRFASQHPDQGWAFEETAPRKGDWATVGLAALLEVEDGACRDVRLAYTAVDERPLRAEAAEDAVDGEPPAAEAFAAAGRAAREALDPPSDFQASSTYRERLIEALTERALRRAADRAGGR